MAPTVGRTEKLRPAASGRHLRRGVGRVKNGPEKAHSAAVRGLFEGGRAATFRRVFPAAEPSMRSVLTIILLVLDIYIWLLIAAAVLSWLIAFNVVNTRNQFVSMLADFLYRVTEPVLRPIRSMLPNMGGIDLSPVILILLIILLKDVIVRYVYPNVF
jgi:YggT family protein